MSGISSPSARRFACTGSSGNQWPLFLGIDTHALSVPACASALEVLAANGVEVMIATNDEYTPTPVISHAITRLQSRPKRRPGRRHCHYAFAQPARQRRLPPQPAQRRPQPVEEVTGWIEARANGFCRAALKRW